MHPVHSVATNLYRFTSPAGGAQHPVNSYILVQPSGPVVIDPAAALTPQIVTTVDARPVTDILITHLQEEHAAGCLNFPDARRHVPAGDEYLCRGRAAYLAVIEKWPEPWDWDSRGNFLGHLGGAPNERPLPANAPLSDSLQPGSRIADFEVVPSPGVGKHAVTLVCTIDGQRVGFCGDLVYGQGQMWNWFDADWDYGAMAGFRTLLESLARIEALQLDRLYPAHGEPIVDPGASLQLLRERLEPILNDPYATSGWEGRRDRTINFEEKLSDVAGFRELLPGLHQWRIGGSCAVLVSDTGNALVVDGGLCHWVPLPERAAHHRAVIENVKQTLGLRRIELILPTHYHGDHTENVPALVAMEDAKVLCLDIAAEPMAHPEKFELACPLPWYDTDHDAIPIHRRVSNGTVIAWHEFELEIFHLPSQTYYHQGIATTVAGKRVLFVGDAIDLRSNICEPVLTYNDAEPEERGWVRGLREIQRRRPDLLVCGHGSAVIDPMPMLEYKLASWQKRLAQYRALSPRPTLRHFFDPFLK